VLLAFSLVLKSLNNAAPPAITVKRLRNAVALLTALATVVRLELALVVLPVALSLVLMRRMSLVSALRAGMIGGFGSLGMFSHIKAAWMPLGTLEAEANYVAAWYTFG
jgi:alpha-1,6-mannosyltransferase